MKKILFSFLLSIIILVSFDLSIISKYDSDVIYLKEYIRSIYFTMPVDKYFDELYAGKTINGAFSSQFRPNENIYSKLKPILFMGCSYAYGDGLESNETVSAKTAKLTMRPVYNRAGRGWGLDQLIYQLRRGDSIKTIGGGGRT